MCVVKVLPLLLLATALRADQCAVELSPKITVTSKQNIKTWDENLYEIPFGADVTVYCTAGNANLTIQNGENYLEIEKLNETTVNLFLRNPNTGRYKYTCKDNQTGCEDSLSIRIIPALSATSPSIRKILDAHQRWLYFVPIGDTYEISCSGNNVGSIRIHYIEGYKIKRLQMQPINNTTMNSKIQSYEVVERNYYCSSMDSATEPITVLVDHYPNADHFQCISYNLRKVECTWRTSTNKHTFKLYSVQNGDIALFCTDNYRETNRGCTANMPVMRYNKLNRMNIDSVILETCNEVFCDNQTFPFDVDSILKLDAPSELKLLNTTSHGAYLTWKSPKSVIVWDPRSKVEYRLLATEWQQANTSSVNCDFSTCTFELPLPCPDSHYELRVFVKSNTAVGERFWSDPTSIFFFTDPQSTDDIDPACTAEFKEREPLPSKQVILFKVRELIRYERKDQSALKKRINALKEKLARVRELMKVIAEAEAGKSGPPK